MRSSIRTGLVAGVLASSLLAACGGSDDAPRTAAQPPAGPPANVLAVSGTAATGLALAGATVDVRCAAGSGTATASATGVYTVNVSDATLPCVVRASGTASGTPVTMHSIVESGAGTGTVTANVTPLTEMIVAQLARTSPQSLFDGFATARPTIDAGSLAAATTAVVAALRTATNIDFAAFDPFKAPLVAATPGTQGNAFDQLLDQLGDRVPPAALPLVVSQIANAAAAAATAPAGSTPPVTIGDVFAGVAGGPMPHCPQVLSGTYRLLDLFGRLSTRRVDFTALEVRDAATNALVSRIGGLDPARPCEMSFEAVEAHRATITGFPGPVVSQIAAIAMGPQGAGVYQVDTQIQNEAAPRRSLGHVFPAQAHPYAAFRGTWLWLESGRSANGSESNLWEHFTARFTVGDEGTQATAGCDLMLPPEMLGCRAWLPNDPDVRFASRPDGGVSITEPGFAGFAGYTAYGYRAPNGAFVMYGTTNPDGLTANTVFRTSFVAVRQSVLPLQTVGMVTPFWNANLTLEATTRNFVSATPPTANTVTVTAVEEATGTITRQFANASTDQVRLNAPIDGFRIRPGTNVPQLQLPLGNGVTVAVNLSQAPDVRWSYNISVARP